MVESGASSGGASPSLTPGSHVEEGAIGIAVRSGRALPSDHAWKNCGGRRLGAAGYIGGDATVVSIDRPRRLACWGLIEAFGTSCHL